MLHSMLHSISAPVGVSQRLLITRSNQLGQSLFRSARRYYARGLFTSPILCKLDGMRGKGWGFKQNCVGTFWGVTAVVYGFLDWPIRSLSKFKLASKTKAVRSSTQSYDQKLAKELWDVSADVAKLPRALTV